MFSTHNETNSPMSSVTQTPTWDSNAAIPRRRIFGFAIGKVGSAIYTTVPGLLLLFYMTDTLAIHAAVAGLVIVLPKVWDVFVAALVGSWSDREASLTGRRTRFMVIGTLSLPLLFVLFFAGPGAGSPAVFWILIVYVLATTAFEMFDIPYLALPSEMTSNPRERTRLMSWRIIATTLGVLVAGAGAPAIVSAAGGGRQGYLVMGAVMGVLLLTTMAICTRSTRWINALPSPPAKHSLAKTMKDVRRNRPFVLLLSAYLPHAVAISIFQAAIAYVAAYLLGNSSLMPVLFIALMGPSLLAVPVWSKVSHRLGKTKTFLAATVLYAACSIGMLVAILWGSTGTVLITAVVLGIAFAGEQVMVYSMIPDTIVHDFNDTGRNTAGVLSGVFQSLETAAFAVGAWVFSLILAFTGFVSTTDAEKVKQSATALAGISYGFTLLPAILLLLTVPLIIAYGRTAAARNGDDPASRYVVQPDEAKDEADVA